MPFHDRARFCLRRHRADLQWKCDQALRHQARVASRSVDFKPAIVRACGDQIKAICGNVTHTNALVVSCLRRNRRHPDMSVPCRREVTSDEIVASQDFALAFRLRLACANDAELLCPDTRDQAFEDTFDYEAEEYKEGGAGAGGADAADDEEPRDGGATLQCLGDHMADIKRKACRSEVFNYLKDVNVDLRIDGPLVAACADEIAKDARRSSAEHLIATKAPRCTATAWILIVA